MSCGTQEGNMRHSGHKIIFILGLLLTLGVSGGLARSGDDKPKRSKNTGILSIRTTEEAYPVKVNGELVGMSGVGVGAEFVLAPGFHTVEVTGPNGKVWRQEIEIRLNQKNCICLKIVRETIKTPCPYRFYLEGPDRVTEGDLITFAAINAGTAPIPLRYAWSLSPNVIVTSGLGTPSITVDTKGLGGRTINAELDVNDDVYDSRCRQVISVPTEITVIPPIEEAKPFRCDEFEARTPDDDKARFDNCVIQAQNTPDSQLYIVIYPGTDRISMTRNTYDRLSRRALDYMVRERRFDPRRISIVRGSSRLKTTYEIWIVPPGAQPPAVR
ncbi:hypothetical protein BH20ACI2_BH20ACI2_28040 [soil metagenome]